MCAYETRSSLCSPFLGQTGVLADPPLPKFISLFAVPALWRILLPFMLYTHKHTEPLYPLSVWCCWAGFYAVSGYNLPGFFPTVLLMSHFSWTPVTVVCQHTHIMYTKQAVMDNRCIWREKYHLGWQHLQLSMRTWVCTQHVNPHLR